MRRIALLALLVALLAACSVFQPPLTLRGTPEFSGIVILRGELVTPLSGWSKVFAGGAKEDVMPISAGSLIAEGNATIPGVVAQGVDALLFAPVAPGRYRVADVGWTEQRTPSGMNTAASTFKQTFDLPPETLTQIPELTFDVRPGQVVYLGSLHVAYTPGVFLGKPASAQGFELRADPKTEAATLSAILQRLGSASPWRGILSERLKALGS